MASPEEMAATMLENLPDKTGKSLVEWHKILKKSSLEKHGQRVNLLKKDHGVTHGFANLIVIKFRESATQTGADVIAHQYSSDKADLRPTYDALVRAVKQFGKDVELAPKANWPRPTSKMGRNPSPAAAPQPTFPHNECPDDIVRRDIPITP